ncbi:hypothetical protein LX59_02550 [Azomonas agilis]|uniref:Aminomethyltransferase folate-binding domain-containing protein n=1 Tax=Azomonas agilis TaxID=116849 RepID=A0A562HZX9_9GAMM|nr:folate-binding protein YgfZ [Azomonas agilis]TWH64347.1 hypothetical protein LX59_02550 [Azomonas agilis]
MNAHAFFCRLDHEGIVAVQGSDAERFLQGQLTCNLKYLAADRSSLGARCTAKGRMQSSFRILTEADQYLLAMDRALVEPQLADLKKYAQFSKSSVQEATGAWVRFGLFDADAVLQALGLELPLGTDYVARHQGLVAIRLSEGRAELWVKTEEAAPLQATLSAQLPEAPLNTWLLHQVRAGIGQVFKETWELFLPQMINLQSLGGVSFKKGCYTGQEIVARTQHLGKIKRRMYRLVSASAPESLPAPGTALYSPAHAGGAAGEVVLAAQADSGLELLAVLQEDVAADGRIGLGHQEGLALTLADLPYTPSAEDAQR